VARRAARDIASAYAHEFGASWCFDCARFVEVGDSCAALAKSEGK
jgi:hypothetical protein